MIKRLFFLILTCLYSVDSFSSHAAGMDLTYECLTNDTVWSGNYQVTISTAAWGNECSWNITDNITGAVLASGNGYNNNTIYNINVCIPSGNFTFNWFDSFGDGWNGGSYTVTTNTGSVLTSGSPTSGGIGSSSFISPGSSCTYTVMNYPANTYRLTLNFYRDCSNGIPSPSTFLLNYSSSSCNYSNSSTMNQVSFQNITPACTSIPNPCSTPGIVGIEEYIYQTIITLPNNCPDWILSVCESARNGAINTILSPGFNDLCVQSELNNTQYCNNSPVFTEYPTPYICVNQQFCYNNGAVDPDGDSLVYTLITPLNSAAGGTVNYNLGYSATNPISGSTIFDPLTGDLCMLANQLQVTIVAMKVSEYRNGVFIGSVIRDIQIIVLDNCSSTPPLLSGIDTIAPVNSDSSGGIATRNFCSDGSSPVIFNINALSDSSNSTNLTMSWNNSIPNASFNISANGTLNPQAIFSWVPTVADVPNSPFYFTVTVIDDACPINNSFSYTYTVNLSNSSGSLVSTDVSCFGLQDGSIDLSVIGGSPPYSYFWWDSISGFYANSEDLINLDIGNYYCWVVDNIGDTLGCGVEPLYVLISEPQELTVSSVSSNVSCFGLNDGSIDLTISGGTSNPNYNISWNSINGYTSSSSNISNLSPDVYTATITDTNGCGPISEIVLITEPTDITIFGTPYDNSCFNSNDASIDLVTSGNIVSWNWIGPNLFTSNQEDISNLMAGTYSVTVSDASTPPCIESATYVVNDPPEIVVTNVLQNVSCFSGNDGYIDLTILPVGNYTTTWTDTNGYFNISEDIFSLSASDYTYSVVDLNTGCTPFINNSPITITEPSDIQLTAVVSDETCYGDANGDIDMTLIGTGSYLYSWTGPNQFSSTSLDISSLEAGTYNLQITDDLSNCVFTNSETINVGNSIQVDTIVNNISCNGFSDGNIVLLTPNSIAPTFIWTLDGNPFNSSSSSILNLEDGNYSVIVNDQTNCPNIINLSISEPPPLSLTSILSNESCDGYQDGEIEIVVTGGTPNYSYIWSNGNTDSINSNLANGEYTLNVVDDNNCILPATFQIDLFFFDTIRQVTNISCFGGSDGSIDLDIIGGNPPFTYQWNGPNGFSSINDSIFNLSTGVYTIDITDSSNCTISRSVVVNQPQQQLSASTNITNHVLCYGDSTGSVLTTIYGGTPPYFLDWGSSDTSQMWAGLHSFTVTDINGCKFTNSINIQQNDSMQISATIEDVQCYGDSNGSVNLQIAQGTGTPPYYFLWIGPNLFSDTTEDIYDLESGDYSIIVTDANMCSQSLNFFVDQPQQISQTTTINPSNYSGYNVRCKGENSAWVDVSVSGGYPPFTYLWNNGDISDSIFNLYAGTYSLQITDSLGCTEDLSLILNEPPTFVSVDVIATSDYNGYHISCFGVNDGSVFAEATDGVGPDYTYLWNNNDSRDSITELYSGYYEVFVYDKNLCLAIDSITLSEPSELFFDVLSYSDTCEKSVGKAEFIASGGVPNYSAVWSDSSTSNIVNHFSEGTYSVEVSDSNSCKKSASFSIDNLESPISDFEAYPYHKRLLDQKNDPFYFVDLTNTFWSSVEYWTWDFGDGFFDYDSLVSHSYDSAGTYTVNLKITTFANCTDTISKDILVDEYAFYIPNTFIPSSSEDENRIFKGYGTGVEEYELKIFSRWGELIFQSNDLDVGWDGTKPRSDYNNFNDEDLCPVGIYTYTVFIENIYGEVFEYQGQLKLLR